MKKLYLVLIAVFYILNAISFAEASCGGSNCSLLTGSQEGVLGQGRFVMDLSYRYIIADDKQSGSHNTGEVLVPKVNFGSGTIEQDKHREFRTINKLAQFDISYGLTEKLTLSLNVPFFNDRFHEHDDDVPPGTFTNQDGTTGFGDLTLLAKYALWRTTKHLFVGGAGIKFATGDYKLRDSEGGINEPTLMPGTGSYDPIISGLYNYAVIPNRLNVFLSLSHRFTTENPLEYLFGDSTFIDGGAAYELTDKVGVSAQINARISRQDKFRDVKVQSTGGEFIFFTPGVRLAVSDNASIYSHIQFPIHQRVNDDNLVTNYGLMLGFSYGF